MKKYISIIILLSVVVSGCNTTSNNGFTTSANIDAYIEKVNQMMGSLSTEEGSVPPKLISIVVPEYPDEVLMEEVKDLVLVKVIVGANGNVQKIGVLESPEPLINNAVITAVKKWKFEPALTKGKPVRCSVVIPVGYVYQELGLNL